MSIISCKNLTLGYDSHVVASGVDFSLNVGDYLCIVGENGSGKTTLMRTLLGFIKPISGSIEMPRDGIGYLPQQTGIQRDFPAGVCEVVRSGMVGKSGFFGFLTKEQKEKADAVMERVGIASLAGKSYRELSGGQQQRVLLARALCASSGILLLDEPASALDPESGMNMYAMISDLNKKEKTTVIMITHDVDNAIGYASHVLDMGASCRFCTGAEYRKEGK